MPTLVVVLAAPGLVVPVLLLVVPVLLVVPLVPPAPVDVRLPGWSDPEEPGLLIAAPTPCPPAPPLVWAVATPSPSSSTDGAIHNFCMIQAPSREVIVRLIKMSLQNRCASMIFDGGSIAADVQIYEQFASRRMAFTEYSHAVKGIASEAIFIELAGRCASGHTSPNGQQRSWQAFFS
jgi:hypothetical protein